MTQVAGWDCCQVSACASVCAGPLRGPSEPQAQPDMAMAGGTDASGLPKALSSVQGWVAERV